MRPEEKAYLESLIAKREATTGDGPRVVTVPGFEDLTEEQQLWVARRVDDLEQEVTLDTETLFSKLENLQRHGSDGNAANNASQASTPSTGSSMSTAAGLAWDIDRETDARKRLEAIGCPPCYPPELPFPLSEPYPEAYRAAMAWFDLDGLPRDGNLLSHQIYKWEKALQLSRSDHGLARRSFGYFIRSVNARRKKYGIFREHDPCLHSQVAEQNLLQNWIEYQDYMFRELEQLEKFMQKRLEVFGTDDFLHEGRVHRLKLHRDFLDWLEQQRPYIERKVKETEEAQDASADDPIPQTINTDVDAKAETTDPPSKSSRPPSTKGKKSKAPAADTAVGAKRQSPRRSTRTKAPELSKKFKSNTVKKSVKRQHDDKPATAPGETKTRSGRISRKPQRWAP